MADESDAFGLDSVKHFHTFRIFGVGSTVCGGQDSYEYSYSNVPPPGGAGLAVLPRFLPLGPTVQYLYGTGLDLYTVQADLMIEMVTRISIYSRRVLSAQDGNPRNKNEFSLFKSWAEVHLQKTLKF